MFCSRSSIEKYEEDFEVQVDPVTASPYRAGPKASGVGPERSPETPFNLVTQIPSHHSVLASSA